MQQKFSLPFYVVCVATLRADADAHLTYLLPASAATGGEWQLLLTEPKGGGRLGVILATATARPDEAIVSAWSRCAAKVPLNQAPHRDREPGFVSISVYLANESVGATDLKLLEHLVVHRLSSRLLVEFSNEESSVELLGPCSRRCANSFELAAEAVGLLATKAGLTVAFYRSIETPR